MKKLILFLFFPLLAIAEIPQTNSCQFFIDLNKIENDQLSVELITPLFAEKEVTYSFARMVPGTYKVYDFGRFVEDLHCYDKQGVELKTTHPNNCDWTIQDAQKLYRISYRVNDSWDADTTNFVFEPAGTNFQKDSNIVLNNHVVYGYFQGKTKTPYTLSIKRPADYYGATSLAAATANGTDYFSTANYNDLVDAPMMYCRPDTTVLKIGGADILISVYSPGKKASAKFIGENVRQILTAAKDYLGGSLPIKKYAFIIYLFPGISGSGSAGALEHCYSSMYFMPEMDSTYLAGSIRDVAAHEFYHVITPLNIHSEEIGDFDFANPKMSKHLWLYEGITEYTAHYVQLRQGLITLEDFMDVMNDKIQTSKSRFNDTLPFTVMSKGCLDTYIDEYQNVYEKGALIGFCLDVKLRQLSGGKTGLQDLINELARRYPKDKSFKDDALFAEITSITYPEIGQFLNAYVGGNSPLPLAEIFKSISFDYQAVLVKNDFSFGTLRMIVDRTTGILVVYDISEMDDFGKLMGYQAGDQIVSINGVKVTISNFQEVKNNWFKAVKENDLLKVKILRPTAKKGKFKKKTLKAKARKVNITEENVLQPMDNPSETQLKALKAWWGK